MAYVIKEHEEKLVKSLDLLESKNNNFDLLSLS